MDKSSTIYMKVYYHEQHWTVSGYGAWRAVLMNAPGSIRSEVGATPQEAVAKLLQAVNGEALTMDKQIDPEVLKKS